jgi:mitochondrial cardiolipin hydrolase
MNPTEIDTLLKQTLSDSRLSPGEKKGLVEWIHANAVDEQKRAFARSRVFALARAELPQPEAQTLLGWLEDVLRLLNRPLPGEQPPTVEPSAAYFSPGEACLRAITSEFQQVKQAADLCVFTITDDRITSAILNAHKRGVHMRILTDNEKALDAGSDIAQLQAAGLDIRIDRTPFHMHHKYAIFDGRRLLNGSYNWTRGAARDNEENVVITSDPQLIAAFTRHFEGLWHKFL